MLDHLRHEQPGDHEQDHGDEKQQREDAVGEQSRRRRAALTADVGIGRHECGIEGAFGEDGAKMIGQPQRHEERVRHRPGTEDRGKHDVAREARDPREKRIAADGEDAPKHETVSILWIGPQNGEIRLHGRYGHDAFSENRGGFGIRPKVRRAQP